MGATISSGQSIALRLGEEARHVDSIISCCEHDLGNRSDGYTSAGFWVMTDLPESRVVDFRPRNLFHEILREAKHAESEREGVSQGIVRRHHLFE